jgi:hypothetical protein
MRVLLVALVLSTSTVALADTVGADPNDYGKVTAIAKGVMEIDAGGIFVISYNKSGDADPNTRVSSLGGVGFQYFVKNNVSVGGNFLFDYDRISATTYSTAFGGTAFASLHVRLGLGAFLRPTLGAGLLVGSLNTEVEPGMVTQASQVSALVRLAMPFAYFPTRRVVLQAGPELDMIFGTVTPDGGDGQSVTTISGGFGVSAGYAF